MRRFYVGSQEARDFFAPRTGDAPLPKALRKVWNRETATVGTGPYLVLGTYLRATPTVAQAIHTGDWPDGFILPAEGHGG